MQPSFSSSSGDHVTRSNARKRSTSRVGPVGVSKRNQQYIRSINHTRCDQVLLKHCQRAVTLKELRTQRKVEGTEEFLWRCLAQPREVRESLIRVDIEHAYDPVAHLISMAGVFKDQWAPGDRSDRRWAAPCRVCANRPYVSWDACFRCGSLADTD